MPAEAASPPAEAAPARDALATLLYGGAFVDGARALGHSARKHSTRAVPFELVSLVTPDVAKKARTCLRRDGWRVLRVSERERPSALAGAPRLHGVYTKLELWGLTRYRRIVYVDADVAAFGSIDALFEFAGDFGAVLRHSELFNTGVLLITPDRPTAKKLRQAAETTFSYTGGDQGFLNEIHDLSKCPAARNGDATAAHDRRTQRRDRGCVRLESNFNGDWALDFARGFPCGAPALLHYSFGAAKPWTWVSAPFLPHVREWCGRRVYLPDECGPRVSANPDRTDEGSDKSPPGTAIAASGPRLWRAGGSLERASGARALKAAFKALLLKRSLKRSGKTRHQLRGELVGCKWPPRHYHGAAARAAVTRHAAAPFAALVVVVLAARFLGGRGEARRGVGAGLRRATGALAFISACAACAARAVPESTAPAIAWVGFLAMFSGAVFSTSHAYFAALDRRAGLERRPAPKFAAAKCAAALAAIGLAAVSLPQLAQTDSLAALLLIEVPLVYAAIVLTTNTAYVVPLRFNAEPEAAAPIATEALPSPGEAQP